MDAVAMLIHHCNPSGPQHLLNPLSYQEPKLCKAHTLGQVPHHGNFPLTLRLAYAGLTLFVYKDTVQRFRSTKLAPYRSTSKLSMFNKPLICEDHDYGLRHVSPSLSTRVEKLREMELALGLDRPAQQG